MSRRYALIWVALRPLFESKTFQSHLDLRSLPLPRKSPAGILSTVSVPPRCMLRSNTKCQRTSLLIKSPSSLNSTKRISIASLLRTSNCFRASVMAVYKVKLIDPVGKEHEFDAPDDSYILDAAEDAGVKLAYSCRAGACSTCAGQMVSVDQT
ncbi:unnamed protein product, partial [Musa acuminata subsp. burmannicoides]